MKRKVTALLAGLTIMASMCCAAVPDESIALDGVAPGSSVEAAKAKLGTPSYRGDKMLFSNGLIIDVDEHRPDVVEEIFTKTAGGAATPGGVQVGMAESVILDVYGQPDKLDRDSDDTEYVYYSSDYGKKMKFKVVGGNIVKIQCELRD